MKRTLFVLSAIIILLTFTACEGLDKILQTNVYSGLGKVSTKEISKADADTLVELGKSPSFFDALKGDPGLTGDVLATINAALAGANNEDTQNLSMLAAEIQLQTTGGAVLVNNIASILANPEGLDGLDNSEDLKDFFINILPPGIVSGGVIQEDAFVALINGFVAANTYFTQLNGALGSGVYADSDVSPGEIAQAAIVSAIVSSIANSVGGSGTPGANLYAFTQGSGNFTGEDFGSNFFNSISNILAAASLPEFGFGN